MITADDFEAWRAHPVTEWVTKALNAEADAAEDSFKRSSWATGVVDPVVHARIASQVRSYRDFSTLTVEDFADMLGEGD